MEYSKKFLIVPEERKHAIEHLTELDEKMSHILKKRDLNESEKAALYLQVLQKYVSYQFPAEKENTSFEHTEVPLVKKEDECTGVSKEEPFLDELMKTAPVKYKSQARAIYQHVKPSLSPQGELVYQNRVVPGSSMVTLINHFLRRRKKSVIGQKLFYELLKNLPSSYDVHRKLYSELSDVSDIKPQSVAKPHFKSYGKSKTMSGEPVMYTRNWYKLY